MRKGLMTIAAAAALAAASGAEAAIVTYVYEGFVRTGHDTTGVFGAADQDLRRLPFKVTFRRNDSAPSNVVYETNESYFDSDSPTALSASITIAGETWIFDATDGEQWQYDQVHGCGPGCDVEAFKHEVESNVVQTEPVGGYRRVDSSYLSIATEIVFGENFLPGPDFRTLPALGPDVDFDWFGDLYIDAKVIEHETGLAVASYRASASLIPETLRVYHGAVPEPGAWALMILGFGAAGSALRARRRLQCA